jgi:hypothetical protein
MRSKSKRILKFKRVVAFTEVMQVTAGKIAAIAMVILLITAMAPVSATGFGMDGKKCWNVGGKKCVKFEKVKEKYLRDKARLKSKHFGMVLNEDTFDEFKEWLIASADLAVASLLSIKEKIENSPVDYPEKEELLEEIDEHIADITAIKEEIENADSVEELREAAKNLKREWFEAKVSLKKAIGLRWIYIMEKMLDRADRVKERVQELIEEYQAQGKNTTRLEIWLEKFSANTDRAREKLEEAKERLMELERNWQINKFLIKEGHALKMAIKYMWHSYLQLKRIIWFINHQQTGEIDLEGEGILFAAGEGNVSIEGSGIVKISGNGSVTAPEENVVVAIGFGEKQVNNGTATYTGEGKIIVRGENLTVTAEGTLKVFAKGSGSVHLEGTGIYKVKGFDVISTGFVEEEYGQEVEEEVEEELST